MPHRQADTTGLAERLPEPPGDWLRSDEPGDIVTYRLPDDDGVCAAAKLVVRPDLLGERAVRLDRTRGCRSAGTDRFDDVSQAVDAVERELAAVVEG